MGCRWRLALLFAIAIVTAGNEAAARPSARLDHSRAEGAETCPDERALVASVTERLGYDPFRADANARVAVTFTHEGDSYDATVELFDRTGASKGRRVLSSDVAFAPCADLAESVVLTVTILLDQPSLSASQETQAVAAPPAASDGDRDHPEANATNERLRVRLGAGGLVGGGFAPRPNAGLLLVGGIGRTWWSIDLEGRIDADAGATYAPGTVTTALRVASVVPCGHLGIFAGCVIAGGGVLSGEGSDVKNPRSATLGYAHAGARAAIEVPLGSTLLARAALDVIVPLKPATIAIGTVDAWTSPSVAGAGSVALLVRFP